MSCLQLLRSDMKFETLNRVDDMSLLEKIVTGSTQNQQRIVGHGCCFGRVGPVSDQQRVVDQFLLIWSQQKIQKKIIGRISGGKMFFYCAYFSTGQKKFPDYSDFYGTLTLPA